MKDIAVIYYAYMVGNWQPLMLEQMQRLKASGLADAAKEIWVISCSPEDGAGGLRTVAEFEVPNDPKWHFIHRTNNAAEYPPLAKAKELADSGDWNILYFHTKGVANTWLKQGSLEVSERKVIGKRGWRYFMEHFLIDKWRECAAKLDSGDPDEDDDGDGQYDMVVAHYGNDHWPHGNFWWASSDWLKQCPPPIEGHTRWYYEGWATTSKPNPRVYEWKHLIFDFHTSDWPAWLYDGSRDLRDRRLLITKATWGPADVQIDEGRQMPVDNPQIMDVTAKVEALVRADGRRLEVAASNSVFGEAHQGAVKMLKVWWTLNVSGEPVYYTAACENYGIILEI